MTELFRLESAGFYGYDNAGKIVWTLQCEPTCVNCGWKPVWIVSSRQHALKLLRKEGWVKTTAGWICDDCAGEE